MHPSPIIRRLLRLKTELRWRRFHREDASRPGPARAACPVCGSSAEVGALRRLTAECYFGGGPIVRHECPECDTVFGSLRMLAMTPAELALEYKELYATYDEADSTASELASFRLLGLRPGGVYLNYGSGRWSRSIEILRTEGYEVWGYEPFVRSGERLPSYLLTEESALTGRRFDGILTHNILEHVQDPVGFTRQLAGWLRPEGRLVHATACFEYAYEISRFHLCFFPGRSAGRLAERAGLELGPLRSPVPGQLARVFTPRRV